MARKEKVVSEAASVEDTAAKAADVASSDTVHKKSKQTVFTVYKGGEPVRTYSVEVHGEDAEELAKEFCAHSGDEVR